MPDPRRQNAFLYPVLLFVVACVAIFNLLYHLGTFPISGWDEARHGASAFEMLQQGHFLAHTYRYRTDYENVKPVLGFWLIVLGYKTIGFTALGLRFYSAFLALLTIVIVTLFVARTHGRVASLVTGIALATSPQFILDHCARTGDADSLFVFLFTAALLSFFSSTRNPRWLYVAGIASALAFLTKSWHAAHIVLIGGLYLVIAGRHKSIPPKAWTILSLSMILPVAAWALLRYRYDGTAFLEKMVRYDLLYRFTVALEGDPGSTGYYLGSMAQWCGYWLILLLGMAIICAMRIRSFRPQPAAMSQWIGVGLWVVLPLTLFSLASIKARWYVLPVYPAVAVAMGMLAGALWRQGGRVTRWVLVSSLVAVSSYYEWQIAAYLSDPVPSAEQELIHQLRGRAGLSGSTLYHDGQPWKAWPQSIVLTAELSNNLKVADGNYAAFQSDRRGLLLLKRDERTRAFIEENALQIVAANPWGVIVRKRSPTKVSVAPKRGSQPAPSPTIKLLERYSQVVGGGIQPRV